MLFRKESVESRTLAYGQVLLVRPVSFMWLTWGFGATILALLLFLSLFEYTRKVEVSGVLLPQNGLTYVVAAQGGVITEQRVEEGQQIAAGDVLFRIANRNVTSTERDLEGRIVSILRQRVASHTLELEQTRRRSRDKLEALMIAEKSQSASVAQLDEQIQLQLRQTQLSAATLQMFKSYEPRGFVSKLDAQLREHELLEQQIRLAELRRARLASARELASTEAAVRDHDTLSALEEQRVIRDIATAKQQLAESEARREILVTSERAGTAGAIGVSLGSTVAAGQSLMAIIPQEATLEVELYAPSSAIGRISQGSNVQLRYHAFPYQTFGFASGKVVDIARTATLPAEVGLHFQSAAVAGRAQPVYVTRVQIDRQTMRVGGREQPLRPGSLVDASVIVESRPLIKWILDPLLARNASP